MAQHGKIEGGSNHLYLVKSGYGDAQVWTVDEFESAREVDGNLEDALNTLRDARSNLPSTFDSSVVDEAIGIIEDMESWYDEALSNAEEI